MTQAFSQTVGRGTQPASTGLQSMSASKSVALFLTDGVAQIKAIEIGTLNPRSGQRTLSVCELAQRLRPGVKVRLRGPLMLRSNVLILPAGALLTLSHPQLQVLGGEVDELLESPDGNVMYQLGLILAKKLNVAIGEDGVLPSWFPCIATRTATSNSPTVTGTPSVTITQSVTGSQRDGPHQPPPLASNSPAMEPWDDNGFDDAVLNEAAQNMEANISRSTSGPSAAVFSSSTNSVARSSNLSNVPQRFDEADRSLEDEVDPDVFAEAMHEL
ncbi:Gamma-aminobutyric acid receptor-associated protein 1 [Fasciola gigantica]|uniref:Gamma-aminobutyric acid receptor-associated protein 1 n=1 Tax=Fasciola gigantica TaxID=46835 RepID=A0A504YE61_FASGI|nr:Gamma-aminobutyric acid receptor-associated protein 1 [Fasciola gigantica]